LVSLTEKDLLRLMRDGPTLRQLTERIGREFSEDVPSKLIGELLCALQDKGYAFLEEGRWWRTPEGYYRLEKILAEEARKKEEREEKAKETQARPSVRKMSLARGNLFARLLLVALSVTLFSLSGYVNQVSLYDDKAYLNNALIHSGRLRKNDVLGPYGDERPPLFWWMLTTLFLFNTPIWSAKYLSPFFGVILVVVTYSFTRKLFNSVRLGFYSGLFLILNAFMLSSVGSVLSDVPGTALSALFLFCLYVGVVEKKNSYLLATGPLLAWSLMMRDQNLILFPIALFYLSTRLRLNRYLRLLIAFASSMLPSILVAVYGLIGTITALSNGLTPIVSGGAYSVSFTDVGLTPVFVLSIIVLYLSAGIYPLTTKHRQRTTFTLLLSALLSFVTMYPYLWDNYLLGTRYEIEGKGVFSRLISHQIMSETIGVGANLLATTRRVWWLSMVPLLVSPPVIIFSAVGVIQMIRERMYSELALLIPWLAFTSGFTVFFTYLEVRFLIPSLSVFAMISSKGFLEAIHWIRSKGSTLEHISEDQTRKISAVIEFSLALVTLLTVSLILTGLDLPGGVGSLAFTGLLNASLSTPRGWFSDYLIYLEEKLASPSLSLDPIYVLESVACLAMVTYVFQRQMQLPKKLRFHIPRIVSSPFKIRLSHRV